MPTLSERQLLNQVAYDPFGFEDHLVPLYAHKPIPSQGVKVGDVVTTKRVIDPKTLNEEERWYFVKKQRYGWFTWHPDQCLQKEFWNSKEVGRYQERHMQKLPPTMGCRWCRSRNNGSEGAGEQGLSEQPSSPNDPGSPSAANQVLAALEDEVAPPTSAPEPEAASKPYLCHSCPERFETGQGMKVHIGLKHSSTPKKRGTRKSAGRKQK